jgi:hypothetical protein
MAQDKAFHHLRHFIMRTHPLLSTNICPFCAFSGSSCDIHILLLCPFLKVYCLNYWTTQTVKLYTIASTPTQSVSTPPTYFLHILNQFLLNPVADSPFLHDMTYILLSGDTIFHHTVLKFNYPFDLFKATLVAATANWIMLLDNCILHKTLSSILSFQDSPVLPMILHPTLPLPASQYLAYLDFTLDAPQPYFILRYQSASHCYFIRQFLPEANLDQLILWSSLVVISHHQNSAPKHVPLLILVNNFSYIKQLYFLNKSHSYPNLLISIRTKLHKLKILFVEQAFPFTLFEPLAAVQLSEPLTSPFLYCPDIPFPLQNAIEIHQDLECDGTFCRTGIG